MTLLWVGTPADHIDSLLMYDIYHQVSSLIRFAFDLELLDRSFIL